VEPSSVSIKTRQRMGIYLILFLCLAVYSNTLGNGFLNFDDHNERILKNPFLTDPWQWNHVLTAFTQATAGYYDPVYVLSYVVDYKIWGWNPGGFHFNNLLLHAVNSIFVFLILFRLTGRYSLALLAGIFFAVHPIHVESVSWATSRKDTLSHFFALAAMLVYFQGESAGRKKYFLSAAGSIVLLLLGMMTKPTVVVTPAIIFLAEVFLLRRSLQWKRIVIYQITTLLILGAYVMWTLPMTLGIAVKTEIQFSGLTHTALFFELYGYFIKLIFFPTSLSAFYLIPIGETLWSPATLICVIMIAGLAGWVGYRGYQSVTSPPGDASPVVWGTGVFLVGLLPFTNALPRSIYLADRYEYLASIGFCTALSALLLSVPWQKVRVAAIAVVILLYSALCINRVPVWKDSPTLWADVNKKRNISALNDHRVMAGAHAFEGQWQKAVEEYEKAGIENLHDPEERMKVANIYSTVGNVDRAEQVMVRTLLKTPDYVPAMNRLIVLHISAKNYAKAREELKKYGPMFTEKENQLFKQLIQNDQTGKKEAAARVYHNLQNSIRSRMNHVQKQNRVGGRSGA